MEKELKRLSLRIDAEKVKALKLISVEKGETMNNIVVDLIDKYIKDNKKK